MDRYNARQTSTVFSDDPAPASPAAQPVAPPPSQHAGESSNDIPSAACVDVSGTQRSISLLSSPDTDKKLTISVAQSCAATTITPATTAATTAASSAANTIYSGGSSSSGGGTPCGVGVTAGCRSCINDSCKEQKREYFLKQQCPLTMAWVRIAGNAPSTMATFEEHAANSLRTSHSFTNLQAAAQRGSQSAYLDSSARRGGSAAGMDETAADVTHSEAECVMPPPRFGHTAVLYKDSTMVVFGGKANDEHYYNDVYAYDIELRRWTKLQDEYVGETATAAAAAAATPSRRSLPSAPTMPRLDSVAAAPDVDDGPATPLTITTREPSTQHSASRAGDSEGTLQGQHEGEMTTPACTTPVTAAPRPLRPCGRVGHAASLYQDSMYILSGERQGKYFDDMWTLDMPTLTWSKACGLPFSPRKGHTMHLLPAACTATRARQDMLVVFGGLVRASRVHPRPADPELPPRNAGEPDMICAPTNETLLYYPTERRWCQLKTCGEQPTPRFYHVSQLITGTTLLLLFGGRTVTAAPVGATTAASEGSFMNDLHILDVSTGMWRQIRDITGDVPSPRMCAASVFVNGNFAVFAGGGDGYCRSAYEFQLGANRWRRLSPNNQPACSRPTVTYAKDRLVFFGGFAPRMGVLNCTMELCLAPLSLSNKCLLWWNRCAFEKHIRTCTQNRLLEKEERAAALAAVARCGNNNGSCGRQVTLHRDAANVSCSPLPTPRQSMMHRGTRRPAPFQAPPYERATSWCASVGSQAGQRDPSPASPSPSYAPSSPVMYSPLSSTSQSVQCWQEAPPPANPVASGGGSFFCASAFRGSPASAAAAAGAAMRPVSAFPTRPDVVNSAHVSCTTENNNNNNNSSSSTAQTPLSYPSPWTRTTTTTTATCAGWPVPSSLAQDGPHHAGAHRHQHVTNVNNNNNGGSSSSNNTSMSACGNAMRAWAEGASSYSAVSPPSAVSNAAPSHMRTSAPSAAHAEWPPNTRVSPRGPAEPTCRIASCLHTVGNIVAAAVPHFYGTQQQPPPQPQQQRGVSMGGTYNYSSGAGSAAGVAQTCAYAPAQSLSARSALRSPAHSHHSSAVRQLRIDVNARTPPSPQFADRNSALPSSPTAYSAGYHGTGGVSAVPSPLSQPPSQYQHQHQQQQQWQQFTRFNDSASSRASSVHSARSTSSEAVALSQVKQLIRQLEGPTGPFLFRAMAARMQKHNASLEKV